MLINSDTLNIYFIYTVCSLVFSGGARLNFMSDLGVSSCAVMLRPASGSHVPMWTRQSTTHNHTSPSQFQSHNVLVQYFMSRS